MLYRYFPTEYMEGQRNLGAIETAIRNRQLRTVSSFSQMYLQSKLVMARAWAYTRHLRASPTTLAGSPSESQRRVRGDAKIVPVGELLANPNDWVLKRALGRVGDDVFVGSLVPADRWRYVVEHVSAVGASGERWIAQRFQPQQAVPTPWGPQLVTLGAYVLDGQFAGLLRAAHRGESRFTRRPRTSRVLGECSMMRRYVVAPIAIFSGACTLRPFTPSVSVAYWPQDVPPVVQATLPDAASAIARWQLPPDNPWSRYEKYTLLSSLDSVPLAAQIPDVRYLELVRLAECAAGHVATAGLPANTAWVVDLRGAASVAFGTTLSRQSRTPVAPIITFNNWPAEDEVIPAEETLGAMLEFQPRMPTAADSATTPVFLLDAWRLAYRFAEVDDGVTDNRYALSTVDLPDPETLRAQGITQLIYVVQSLHDTEIEEDDLNETMVQYQAAGIQLVMLDLPGLCAMGDSPTYDWAPFFAQRFFRPVPRLVLMQNPLFYARSRGGFGGVHAGPCPWRMGGAFRAAHGGG